MIGPLSEFSGLLAESAKSLSRNIAMQSVISGPFAAMMANAQSPGQIQHSYQVPLRLSEMAGKLNDQYSLVKLKDDLDKYILDLKAASTTINPATGKPLIDKDVFDKALAGKLTEVGGKLGIGGEPRLHDAALVGTVEDARLLARNQVGFGDQSQDTNAWLERIYEEIKRNTEGMHRIAATEAFNNNFVNVDFMH